MRTGELGRKAFPKFLLKAFAPIVNETFDVIAVELINLVDREQLRVDEEAETLEDGNVAVQIRYIGPWKFPRSVGAVGWPRIPPAVGIISPVHRVQLAWVRSQGGRRLALNRSMWTPVHAPPRG